MCATVCVMWEVGDHATAHVWRSGDNLTEPVLYVDSRNGESGCQAVWVSVSSLCAIFLPQYVFISLHY